jgi:hypothetical protein
VDSVLVLTAVRRPVAQEVAPDRRDLLGSPRITCPDRGDAGCSAAAHTTRDRARPRPCGDPPDQVSGLDGVLPPVDTVEETSNALDAPT